MKFGDKVLVGCTVAIDYDRPIVGRWRPAVLVEPRRNPPIGHWVVRYDDGTQYSVPEQFIKPLQ